MTLLDVMTPAPVSLCELGGEWSMGVQGTQPQSPALS